jgi:hypothetical protein
VDVPKRRRASFVSSKVQSMIRMNSASASGSVCERAPDRRRVEPQLDFTAVVVKGKNPSHVLHLLLSLITLGLWLFVWAAVSVFGGERRRMIEIDEHGFTRINSNR